MSDKWYFSRGATDGQGPVTLQELQAKCTFGDLSAADRVWHEGMPQWVTAGSVPELIFPPTENSAPPQVQPVMMMPLGTVNYSQPHPDASITCSPRTIDLLRQTRPWARVIAVAIFTIAGLMVLGGFAMMGASAFGARNAFPGFAGIIYLALAGLYLTPAIYLNRYCSRITQLVALRRDDLLEQAIEAQKSFWKFCGIFALVVLCIYAVVGIVMVIALVVR